MPCCISFDVDEVRDGPGSCLLVRAPCTLSVSLCILSGDTGVRLAYWDEMRNGFYLYGACTLQAGNGYGYRLLCATVQKLVRLCQGIKVQPYTCCTTCREVILRPLCLGLACIRGCICMY
jgi:hypothetical protein